MRCFVFLEIEFAAIVPKKRNQNGVLFPLVSFFVASVAASIGKFVWLH